jgi:hypothetical protein
LVGYTTESRLFQFPSERIDADQNLDACQQEALPLPYIVALQQQLHALPQQALSSIQGLMRM